MALDGITDDEIKLLESVNSEDEWNSACDIIKAVRDGKYPSDWWAKVKLSGMMSRIFSRFGASPEIKISYL